MAEKQTSRKKHSAATEADPPIPDKLYFRIGEVARLLSIAPYVLRFWESEFPQLHPNKGGTGQRLYRRRDVETALRIKRLLYQEGYTIPGARQLLKSEPREQAAKVSGRVEPVVPVVETAQDRLRRVRSELEEIASLLESPVSVRPVPRPVARPAVQKQAGRRGLHITAKADKASQGAAVLLFPEQEAET